MQIRYFDPDAKIIYGSDLAAGFDLMALMDEEVILLKRHETVKVPTGLAIHINQKNLCGLVLPRSGAAKRGLTIANSPGLIDPDYQGEICVLAHNNSEHTIAISRGDRIAQFIVAPVNHPVFEVVKEFSETSDRGTKGFGSSGV